MPGGKEAKKAGERMNKSAGVNTLWLDPRVESSACSAPQPPSFSPRLAGGFLFSPSPRFYLEFVQSSSLRP